MFHHVLRGAGRICNVGSLGFEGLGIEAGHRGFVVDNHMRASAAPVNASGDVVVKTIPHLTPTTEFESNYIAVQILGGTDPIRYSPVPSLAFTLSRIAQVGVTVDETDARSDAYHIVGLPYGVQNEWINNRELDIEMTPIIDGEGHLVGAAIYGSEGGTWVDILTLAITERLTGRPAIQDLRLPDADLHVGNHLGGSAGVATPGLGEAGHD